MGRTKDSLKHSGNPCSSTLVDTYISRVSEEQKQVHVPVNQAARLLAQTLGRMLQSVRTHAQLTDSTGDRITITVTVRFVRWRSTPCGESTIYLSI